MSDTTAIDNVVITTGDKTIKANLTNLKTAVSTSVGLAAPLASPTFTGTPAAPTASSSDSSTTLATTAFVQTAISSAVYRINYKQSVLMATTAPLPANTKTGSGIGMTLTATANGVLLIDGVTVNIVDIDADGGDTNPYAINPATRVLVKDETEPKNNGIFHIKNKGTASAPFALVRALDSDTGAKLNQGSVVLVEQGTVNIGKSFVMNTPDPITMGTSPIVFALTDINPTPMSAGDGLTLTGNTLAVVADPASAVTSSGSGVGVNTDGTSIRTFNGALELMDNSVNASKISSSAFGDGLQGGSGTAVSVKSDTTTGGNIAGASITANGVGIDISKTLTYFPVAGGTLPVTQLKNVAKITTAQSFALPVNTFNETYLLRNSQTSTAIATYTMPATYSFINSDGTTATSVVLNPNESVVCDLDTVAKQYIQR